jgi:hypothetical protein
MTGMSEGNPMQMEQIKSWWMGSSATGTGAGFADAIVSAGFGFWF